MNLSKRLRSSILDEDMFWMYVQKPQELIHPIVKWIFLLESDKTKISTVPQCFKELNDHFTKCLAGSLLAEKERQDVTKSYNKRKDMALKDIHYAAHILDPKFNGECLSKSEQIQGAEFIDKVVTRKSGTERSAEVIAELAEYRSKEGFLGQAFVLKSVSATEAAVWWKGVCYGSKSAKVAVSILSMPPTSAATERSFSTYSIVHTAKRNR
jgi:hypothetical protein